MKPGSHNKSLNIHVLLLFPWLAVTDGETNRLHIELNLILAAKFYCPQHSFTALSVQ